MRLFEAERKSGHLLLTYLSYTDAVVVDEPSNEPSDEPSDKPSVDCFRC